MLPNCAGLDLKYADCWQECSPADVRIIFGDIEVILAYAEQLLIQLQQVISTWHVASLLGPIFIKTAQYLKVYVFFINGFATAMDTLGMLCAGDTLLLQHSLQHRSVLHLIDIYTHALLPFCR